MSTLANTLYSELQHEQQQGHGVRNGPFGTALTVHSVLSIQSSTQYTVSSMTWSVAAVAAAVTW